MPFGELFAEDPFGGWEWLDVPLESEVFALPTSDVDLAELIRQGNLSLYGSPPTALEILMDATQPERTGVPFSFGVSGIDEEPLTEQRFNLFPAVTPVGRGHPGPFNVGRLTTGPQEPGMLQRLLSNLGRAGRGIGNALNVFPEVSRAASVSSLPIPESRETTGLPARSPVLPFQPVSVGGSGNETAGLAQLLALLRDRQGPPPEAFATTRANLLRPGGV